jgi:hypothetical protein|tara:strand:+ start:258 stop:599 length:342 start_codon:yes stop_codon:yes gene_type:complete
MENFVPASNKPRLIQYKKHPECHNCINPVCGCHNTQLQYGNYYTYKQLQEAVNVSKATIKGRLYGKPFFTDRDLYRVGDAQKKPSDYMMRTRGSDKLETSSMRLSDKWLRVLL